MSQACVSCSAAIAPFMSFGRMPIANGFLRPDEVADEYFFELTVAHCAACGMVQLTEHVERERMFHERYAFYSSTSTRMAEHFEGLAIDVRRRHLAAPDPLVVEIGSNDGILLRHFAAAGVRHVGVEPSANVAEAARARGVRTVSRFFDAGTARDLVAEHGRADVLLGANVFCHLPYLHSVAEGVGLLLKEDGVLVFEDPYLGDIVEKTSYDQIYDEHAVYFSLGSVARLFEPHGLEVVDVTPLPVHGGSMRYTIARRGRRPPSAQVAALAAKERQLGLLDPATYVRLRGAIERSRDQLVEALRAERAAGRRVVGYGATSKSTTVTNYCKIGPELVEFISDTTPIKQGKLSPGAHIPVRPYAEFLARFPERALLFAWNHADEIRAKEKAFVESGGRWIVYVPRVEVL